MSNFAFPSTGDAEQDRKLAEDFNRSQSRLDDNVCPNGCSRMVFDNPFERHCPVCSFSQYSNAPLSNP
jgi:hypothetical protein